MQDIGAQYARRSRPKQIQYEGEASPVILFPFVPVFLGNDGQMNVGKFSEK